MKDEKNNQIIGDLKLSDSTIEFKGSNNILYCNGSIELKNSKIRFTGSNSLVYLDSNDYPFSINIRVGNDSVFYLGKNCFLNRTSNFYATERKNIIIGKDCLISFDCYFRTADPHLIYEAKTKKRINNSKSILIGDHVWIGQSCLLLKNTCIGSGAIIGGHAVLSNKEVQSNTLYAGNPARRIKENVFYPDAYSTHNYTLEDENNSQLFDSDDYVYENDNFTLSLKKIDEELRKFKDVGDKLEYIENNISNNDNKNRFYL